MNVAALLQGFGAIGLFSSRIFLPAFLTALLLRFGPDIPIIHHLGLLGPLQHGQPTWFTSDAALIVLGVLSLVEFLAQKNPEARQLLQEFDVYLKAALAALTTLGVMRATDVKFVQDTMQHAGVAADLWPLLVALGTYRVATVRKTVATEVFDHLDGTGLDHLINWLEDAWVVFGTWLLVLFPILMLILLGIGIGVLFLIRKRLEVLEEQRKVPCTGCGVPIYPCAIACPTCRHGVAQPVAVGFLGASEPYPTDDLANHPYRLVSKRRCLVCAARRLPRRPFEPCPACGNTAMSDPQFTQAYMEYVGRRLPVVLGVSFLMSLVPIVGLIVGVIYYRMELVLPFSQYLPLGKRFLLRWGIRLLFIVLILFQIVPVIGGFVVPLMAYISFTAYRNSYRSLMLGPR